MQALSGLPAACVPVIFTLILRFSGFPHLQVHNILLSDYLDWGVYNEKPEYLPDYFRWHYNSWHHYFFRFTACFRRWANTPTLHTGRDYPLGRLHIWAAYHTLPFLPAPFTMEDTLDFLLSSLW